MNLKRALIAATAILVAVSIASFILGIWTSDGRWGWQGFLLIIIAVPVGLTAVFTEDYR